MPGQTSFVNKPTRKAVAPPRRGAGWAGLGEWIRPVSFRGFLFSLLAAGLIYAGASRAELGALLAGTGMGSAVALSLLGVSLEKARYRKALSASPEALRLVLSAAVRDDKGETASRFSVFNASLPSPRTPGVAASVFLALSAENGRAASASAALPAPGESASARVPGTGALPRGVYTGAAALEIRDMFGFCLFRLKAGKGLEAVVYPEARRVSNAPIRGSGGERLLLSDLLETGEDRFDSRPYIPGDDPRRVHWKQYARFGDLFVRPGDLSPPPQSAVRVFLDTERPAYMEGAAGLAYLDALAQTALGFVELLRERGRIALCSAPDLPDAPKDGEGLRRWFAALAWSEGPTEEGDRGPEPLAIFGAPGAAGRSGLLAARSARGQHTLLGILDLPRDKPRTLTERLFLAPPGGKEPEPGRGFRASFTAALSRERGAYGELGGLDVRVF